MLLKYCVLVTLAWAAQVSAAENTFFNIKKSGSPSAGKGLSFEKIVGGSAASIWERPFMAHISIQTGKTYSPQCGGTILDKNHILTAAHCVTNRTLSYRVRVGSSLWASGGQLVDVTDIAVPAEYDKAAAFDYDVAVLRVSRSLVFGQAVKAVSLVPVGRSVAAKKEITVVGWGYTDALHSQPLPAQLREVTVETIRQAECRDDFSGSMSPMAITARMFCGMGAGERDSCQGDSGGPVYDDKLNQQVGIVSWGLGCAQLGSPSVYTNLADSAIRSFIAKAQKS